jgi:hypothetical protein
MSAKTLALPSPAEPYSAEPGAPLAKSSLARPVYPALAWDNLFDNRGSLQNISILDRVKDRAQDLSKCVSTTGKGKLDEYLTSVREVEKRVEGMRKGKEEADDAAKAKNTVAVTMDRPANGLPEDLRDHARLMCDIIAIAYQTNKTRVASLIISRDLSAMYYPFLDVKEGHHSASHNNNSDGYERIARFHVEQYATCHEVGQHERRQRQGGGKPNENFLERGSTRMVEFLVGTLPRVCVPMVSLHRNLMPTTAKTQISAKPPFQMLCNVSLS